MIYSVHGKLAAVEENLAVVDCGGVGYGVRTSSNTLGRLPGTGEEVFLYTHLSVREDAVELFGFFDRAELRCFKMLTAVGGVGPKAALAILSELSPERLMLCVAAGDAKAITRANGVGTKLANRIVLELKDKIGAAVPEFSGTAAVAAPAPASNAGEAAAALAALGYSPADAAAAAARFPADAPVQDIIKGSLKILAGK